MSFDIFFDVFVVFDVDTNNKQCNGFVFLDVNDQIIDVVWQIWVWKY